MVPEKIRHTAHKMKNVEIIIKSFMGIHTVASDKKS